MVVICCRANTALKLRFDVPKELRNHFEILPHTGFIQAQSQCSAQLKFLPRFTQLYDIHHLSFKYHINIFNCIQVVYKHIRIVN